MNAVATLPTVPSILPLASGGMLAPASNPAAAAFAEEAKGQAMTHENDLLRVRIDHMKGMFTIQGQPIGDKVEGFLLHYFQQRTYFSKPYKAGTKTPPDCSSIDCVTPLPNSPSIQAPSCSECKHSQFGSKGDGQGCATRTSFFLLNPEMFQPHGVGVLDFPPTSIKNMLGSQRQGGGYVGRAKQFRLAGGAPAGFYQIVWGRFTLEKSDDGRYCSLVGEPTAIAPEEEAKAIAKVRKVMMQAFERLQAKPPEETAE